MRVLFTTQPGIGHLHPLLPLARGMAQHGHTVAFACARGFVPEVQRAGCGAFPVGRDWLTVELEQEFPEIREILPGALRLGQGECLAGATAPEEGERTLAWLCRVPERLTVYATLGAVHNSTLPISADHPHLSARSAGGPEVPVERAAPAAADPARP
jgi:hypothetical protein